VEAFDDAVARRLESLAKAEPGTSLPTDWNFGSVTEPTQVREDSHKPSIPEPADEDALLRQELAASLSRLESEVRQSATETKLKLARQFAEGM
jgi:hypothetical protein